MPGPTSRYVELPGVADTTSIEINACGIANEPFVSRHNVEFADAVEHVTVPTPLPMASDPCVSDWLCVTVNCPVFDANVSVPSTNAAGCGAMTVCELTIE